MTLEEFKSTIEPQVEERLDLFAKTRGYRDIVAACSYINSGIQKYATEAAYCVSVRDNTWATVYSIFDDCESGARSIPNSYEEIESELPTLNWPV